MADRAPSSCSATSSPRSSGGGAPGRCSPRSRSSRSCIGIAIRLVGGSEPGPRPRVPRPDHRTTASSSALAALTVAIPLFLPLTVSVAAGDAIAGEASHGTLRYLLIAPAGRVRLLLVKYLAAAAFCLAATAHRRRRRHARRAGCSSRSARSRCSRARRCRSARGCCGCSAIGGVRRGVAASACRRSGCSSRRSRRCRSARWRRRRSWRSTAQIVGAIPQLEALHPWLFTDRWLDFADLLRSPIVWDSFAGNALLQGGYILVFGAAAIARFSTKDVLS